MTEVEEIVAAHQFTTWTMRLCGGIVTSHAGCSCDSALRFDWYGREEQHRSHLLEAVFAAGQDSGRSDLQEVR